MGWEIRSGVHVSTDGPIPATGTVTVATVRYIDGRPYPLRPEALPVDRLAAWHGYSVDMHGDVPLDPRRPRKPTWNIFEDDGTLLYTLELDRIRLQAAGSNLFAELIVLPIEGVRPRPGIFGWETGPNPRIPSPAEVEKAVRGLELLGLVRELEAARRRGRPRRYTEANESRFFEELKQASHAAVRGGDHVTYSSLATYGPNSRPTVTDAIERFGYDLEAIEAEANRCTGGGANFCTFLWRDRAKFKKNRP